MKPFATTHPETKEKIYVTSYEIVSKNKVSVDLNTYTISYNGKIMQQPRKVIKMVHYMMNNRHKIITREDLLKDVWGTDVIVDERTVDVHIRKIRSAICNDCIETVKGVGYQWISK
jgi:two-component system alkaline phosphatase synthesis response regulator PhoP